MAKNDFEDLRSLGSLASATWLYVFDKDGKANYERENVGNMKTLQSNTIVYNILITYAHFVFISTKGKESQKNLSNYITDCIQQS